MITTALAVLKVRFTVTALLPGPTWLVLVLRLCWKCRYNVVNVLVNLKMLALVGRRLVWSSVPVTVLRLVASTSIGLYAVAVSVRTCVWVGTLSWLVRLVAFSSTSVVLLVTRGDAFMARRRLTVLQCASIRVLLLGWLVKVGGKLVNRLVAALGCMSLLWLRLASWMMSWLNVLDVYVVVVPVRALMVQVLSRLWAKFLWAVPRLVVTFTRIDLIVLIIVVLDYRELLLEKTGIWDMSLILLVITSARLLVWTWVVVAVIVLTLDV